MNTGVTSGMVSKKYYADGTPYTGSLGGPVTYHGSSNLGHTVTSGTTHTGTTGHVYGDKSGIKESSSVRVIRGDDATEYQRNHLGSTGSNIVVDANNDIVNSPSHKTDFTETHLTRKESEPQFTDKPENF